MLSLLGGHARLCDSLTRREALRLGGLSALGLSLPQLLGRQAQAAPALKTASFGKAKSCIVLFLMGGPPQHSTWDPKPNAPADIRGQFKPISTAVPGIQIGELFPQMAKHTD